MEVFCFFYLMEKSGNLENERLTVEAVPLEQVSVLHISNINTKSPEVSREAELLCCLVTAVA